MTAGRPAVVWGLVAGRAAAAGRRVSVADVCTVAVGCAQVSGAWVTVSGGRRPDFVMSVTGPVSEQLAELQLTLGEGPCHDVLASTAPVLAADLGDEDSGRRWPGFAASAGPRASFGDALTLADAATLLLLDGLRHDGDGAAAAAGGPAVDGQ